MPTAPPKTTEGIVGFFIPPACREYVLGDLHERYVSPRQYIVDALRTVPLVILSRIRRTTDPQILLLEAFALYLSLVGTTWLMAPKSFVYDDWGLLRPAVPAAVALITLVFVDAYADPKKKSLVKPMLQAGLGIGFAFLSQATFWATNSNLAVPLEIMIYGGGGSLILISALRMFFAPGEPPKFT
jgi:hypothetical protein